MKKEKQGKCYWCGKEGDVTDEHVPPRSFFPKGKRVELITVPSCKEHNEDFSKLDEKFKVLLQMSDSSNTVAKTSFRDKTVRGLQRKESSRFHKSIQRRLGKRKIEGNVTSVYNNTARDVVNFHRFFEKIVRGLYFKHVGKNALKGNVFTSSPQFVLTPSLEKRKRIINALMPRINMDQMTEGQCKNPDVFYYKYYITKSNSFLVNFEIYEGVKVVGTVSF